MERLADPDARGCLRGCHIVRESWERGSVQHIALDRPMANGQAVLLRACLEGRETSIPRALAGTERPCWPASCNALLGARLQFDVSSDFSG